MFMVRIWGRSDGVALRMMCVVIFLGRSRYYHGLIYGG